MKGMKVIEFLFCSKVLAQCATQIRVCYSPGRDRCTEETKGKGPIVGKKRSQLLYS